MTTRSGDNQAGVWKARRGSGTTQQALPFAASATSLVAAILLLPSLGRAGGVVTNGTEAALRAALAGGGTVTFACDGPITLANTITNNLNLTLDGSGHQVTISGGLSVRGLLVNANATLTTINLTIANGQSVNGSGIFNNGGTVNATNCTFSGNSFASNGNSNAPAGGAIYNGGGTVLFAKVRFFVNNSIQGDFGAYGWPTSGCDATGGAIYNAGSLLANSCSFLTNSALGGRGGTGGGAQYPFPGLGLWRRARGRSPRCGHLQCRHDVDRGQFVCRQYGRGRRRWERRRYRQ